MPRGIAKANLPSKICAVCLRPFTWRKKWESCWDSVLTCSKRCRAERRRTKQRPTGQQGAAGGGGDNGALNGLGRVRYELFFKNAGELARQVEYLAARGASRFNIPNKGKRDPMAKWSAVALEHAAGASVCPHYSLKNQYQGSPDDTLARFETFCKEARAAGIDECLLVSGGGKKRKSDLSTLACLRRVQRRRASPARKMRIGVAFNPFFPAEADRAAERKALASKLDTGLVSSVWLQIGSDLTHLREGLEYVTAELDRRGTRDATELFGSVFVPSPRLLNQMKFRPWNGVFLSEQYLGSVENAEAITVETTKVFADYGVQVLCETALRSERDARRFATVSAPVTATDAAPADAKTIVVKATDSECPQVQVVAEPTVAEVSRSKAVDRLKRRADTRRSAINQARSFGTATKKNRPADNGADWK